jgi:uncharacterized protein YkwD
MGTRHDARRDGSRMLARGTVGILLLALLEACGSGPVPPAPAPTPSLARLEAQVLARVNAHRARIGLAPLRARDDLARIARTHSHAMASGRESFGHGGWGWRKQSVAEAVAWTKLGENVYRNWTRSGPEGIPDAALRSWLGSSGHRQKIEAGEYVLTGVGASVSPDGTYYLTQLFVVPMRR